MQKLRVAVMWVMCEVMCGCYVWVMCEALCVAVMLGLCVTRYVLLLWVMCGESSLQLLRKGHIHMHERNASLQHWKV